MRLCLLDADHFDGERSVVRLFCKSGKKNVVCLDYDFEPYFYVLPKRGREGEVKRRVGQIAEAGIKRVEVEERLVSGEKRSFLKVFCLLSSDLSKARDVVKQWESDRGGSGLVEEEYEYTIPFYKQYLLAKGISGMGCIEVEGEEVKKDYSADKVLRITKVKPLESGDYPDLNVMAFDIETVEEGGSQVIVMISMKSKTFERVLTYKEDRRCGKYVEFVKDERDLLQKFVKIVNMENPDVLVGYNSDAYDMQIIRKRADELKVELALSKDRSKLMFTRRSRTSAARFKGLVHIDLFEFISNILSNQMQTEVMTLDAVSAELLGDSKIEMDYEEMLESWRKGKDIGKLAEYCLKDTELTLRLSEFVLPQIYALSRLSGQLPFDAARMTFSQLVEWYLSRRAYQIGNIVPNQPKWDEIQRRGEAITYEGGFVKEPIAGLHESIAVMDFRSLYPSIIATFNISPETFNCADCRKDGYEVPGTKYWFCKKRKGFVSDAIKELIEKRAKIRKDMKSLKKNSEEWHRLDREQFAIKTVANATYGYLGFPGSKWYCRECAQSSAAFGRFYINKAMDNASKEGFTVIYADTDSMFVKADGNLESKVKLFLKNVNKGLPGMMELNLQGFYKRGIFIPKGVGTGTAKKRYALIDESGALTIRGLERVRRDWSNVAKSTQESVLKLVLGKKDVDGAVKFTQDVIRSLRQGKVSLKDLIIYEQLAKPLTEYKVTAPHVVAARKMKERGKSIGQGMVVMFVITKGRGSISEKAEPIEDVEINDVDVEYYIHNQIVPAALRVLTVLGVSEEQLVGGNLKSFLK